MTAIQYLRNGSPFAAETFGFSRDGDISLPGDKRTYDLATGRMTARAWGSYGYDRAGNLVSWTPSGGTTWTYTYDPLDRLVAVRYGGTVVARYAYDVLGRRIVKRVYGGANAGYLRMIYAGDAVAAEADSGGTLALGYTWGLGTDDLVAVHRYSDSGHWYVMQDQLRSVRGLTRREGTWVVSWRYRIYGAGLDSLGTAPFALRYRWTGREYDAETGLYYFRARYYDPGSQRFVQEDPIGYAGGANLYGYAGGNPVMARDPSGLAAGVPDPRDECSGGRGSCDQAVADPFAGGAGGSGGSWMDEFLSGWDILTSYEQADAYDNYAEAAQQRIDAWGGERGWHILPALEPMSHDEYGLAWDAVHSEVPVRFRDERGAFEGVLASGRIVLDRGHFLGFNPQTLTGQAALYSGDGPRSIIIVHQGVFQGTVSRPYRAYVLMHEVLHGVYHATPSQMCSRMRQLVPRAAGGGYSFTCT